MSDRSIKSAERTLALFELFSAAERPLAVNEVVHALGIPQSSATMLLQNMAALGYLEYLPELRKYKPSIRLFLLNCWVLRRFGEAADFMEAFNALHEMAGEIMQLAIQNGPVLQAILSRGVDESGRHHAYTQSNFGGDPFMIRSHFHGPLTFTAAGRMLLSLKPDAEILSWVKRCNAQATSPRWRVSATDFMRDVERIRKLGYSESDQLFLPGICALSICVRSPMDVSPLAVSISLSVESLAQKREMLLQALLAFRDRFTPSQAELTEDVGEEPKAETSSR